MLLLDNSILEYKVVRNIAKLRLTDTVEVQQNYDTNPIGEYNGLVI